MKYTVPIIASLACGAVQALPLPDDRGVINNGVNGLLDDVNNLMCGLGTDVGNLLGTLAARFKRGLPNEVFKLKSERANLVTGSLSTAGLSASLNLGVDADEDVSLELGGKVKRSPGEENEEAPDCGDGEDTPDNSALDDGSTADSTSVSASSAENTISGDSDDGSLAGDDSTDETTSDTANSAENTVSDDSSLVDDSSLTANDIENGVSGEGADQTDLSRRTIAPSAGALLGGIGSAVGATGVILGDSVSGLKGIVAA